jgi:hypothetical protein
MKGILLGTKVLGGKEYTYNSITKGIIASPFPVGEFYGGRVTRFGKTDNGLLLCLEKNEEQVIDIFVDVEKLDKLSSATLKLIAARVKERRILTAPKEQRKEKEEELKINPDATKDELAGYIVAHSPEILEAKE